jgi:hypothetical protein
MWPGAWHLCLVIASLPMQASHDMPLHPLEHEAPHGAVRRHRYASTCMGVEQSELEEPCLATCVYILRLSSHEGRRHHVGVCEKQSVV